MKYEEAGKAAGKGSEIDIVSQLALGRNGIREKLGLFDGFVRKREAALPDPH